MQPPPRRKDIQKAPSTLNHRIWGMWGGIISRMGLGKILFYYSYNKEPPKTLFYYILFIKAPTLPPRFAEFRKEGGAPTATVSRRAGGEC